ncbi:MAG TPA: 1-deoxy-D-xylulose-5-phosphate reductoisomerase [Vicinamibacteria bacterium]|nr:1-deoxy-D-xylulose-5-phosphate reductoisomerase [Vicinamibacteria bacterium]
MKGVAILGSTGSIGRSTLRVIERFPRRFRVVGLAAGRNIETFRDQIAAHRPELVSVVEEADARRLRTELDGVQVKSGVEGLVEVATHPDVELVVSATVGAVGLVPTLESIEAGKVVALANKETLVMAGRLMMEAVRRSGASLLPVDSEHNAIHQCLAGRSERLRRIWLTASGGPFRNLSLAEMREVTPEQALKHPTWQMGQKITIDSATMMNKGLEVIEARWLFGASPDRIRVVVHPQSTVHSMVEFEDGSLIAQLGVTDMRLPIQYALTYPERLDSGLSPLDLETPMKLDFEPPDFERFPCLALAYRALELGDTAPAVLNAANEVAVAAFLERRIGFLTIGEVLAETLSRHAPKPAEDLSVVIDADRWAREEAERLLGAYASAN